MTVNSLNRVMTEAHSIMVTDGLPFISSYHFERIKSEFLLAQDDEVQEENYCTRRKLAEEIFERFEGYLFVIDRAREARYAMYLELQAEFGKEAPK